MKTVERDMKAKRGSVLLMGVIFATIAAVALGSYIRLAGTEMRMANAQLYSNAAINLAEAGVEEVLYAINRDGWVSEGWTGQDSGNVRKKEFLGIELGGGATGDFLVRVNDAKSDTPTVIVQAEVTSGGNTVVRQIETQLERRSLFNNGATSLSAFRISGNKAVVASYRSSDPNEETLDGGSVASVTVIEDVDVGNSEIWGYVATAEEGILDFGPNATIGGFDSTEQIDWDRITEDFSATFPPVSAPDVSPHEYVGDPVIQGSTDPENPMYWRVSESYGDLVPPDGELQIEGHVVLIVENGVKVSGNDRIVLNTGGSVKMYVNGDVQLGGNGTVNATGYPANMQIYGTNPTSQSISIGGNAEFRGVVYAPNGDISLNGGGSNDNGTFRGAMVGNNIKLNGGVDFYYDEDLASLLDEGAFGASTWYELHGSERHDYF